jgi:hypothetical protein
MNAEELRVAREELRWSLWHHMRMAHEEEDLIFVNKIRKNGKLSLLVAS